MPDVRVWISEDAPLSTVAMVVHDNSSKAYKVFMADITFNDTLAKALLDPDDFTGCLCCDNLGMLMLLRDQLSKVIEEEEQHEQDNHRA